jgi:hypothetical protein
VNYVDKGFEINLNPERYRWTLDHGLHARMALDLPAAQGTLRVAILDQSTGHTGSLEVPIAAAK